MSSTLDSLAKGKKLDDLAGFKWKNRGSMVFIGDYQVSQRSLPES
jgi:hypothetical protein